MLRENLLVVFCLVSVRACVPVLRSAPLEDMVRNYRRDIESPTDGGEVSEATLEQKRSTTFHLIAGPVVWLFASLVALLLVFLIMLALGQEGRQPQWAQVSIFSGLHVM